MLNSDGQAERRIVRGHGSAGTQSRLHEAGSARTRTTGATGRTAGACSRCSRAVAANSATRSALYNTGINATKASASLRSQKIGISNRQVITGDCQVQIVFESEVNRVFQRQVQFTVADQTIQTGRICEYRLGYMIGSIWTEWIMGFWHLQFGGRSPLRTRRGSFYNVRRHPNPQSAECS